MSIWNYTSIFNNIYGLECIVSLGTLVHAKFLQRKYFVIKLNLFDRDLQLCESKCVILREENVNVACVI